MADERKSYWLDRQGIDRGEPTKSTYALHALVGHHGSFFADADVAAERGRDADVARLAGSAAARAGCSCHRSITVVCLVFFIGMRPQEDRNYGGMTSGFRWMFWCAPLWLVVMLPAADRLARSDRGMALAVVLLDVLGALRELSRRGIPGRIRGSTIG